MNMFVALVFLIAAAFGTLYLKIQNDAVQVERAKVEREKSNAVTKANKARVRVRTACERTDTCELPNRWFR